MVIELRLDDDDLSTCVSCGLCLPHCPTYRVTGDESASPRGRIAAMRSVQWGDGDLRDPAFAEFMDHCIQCRGCETACPSAVPFGRLMEGSRAALVASGGGPGRVTRLGFAVLGHHRLLLALTTAGAVAQRLRLVPPRLARRMGLPALPVRRPALAATGSDVWLYPGCVMDAWMRPTHVAVARVVAATGTTIGLPGAGGDCCGALHVHSGLLDQARRLARRVMASMPGDAPILVDSAGCGAALKDYGHLLDTEAGAAFSARVVDVHEWLAVNLHRLPPPPEGASRAPAVAIQDPCHLRHVQRCAGHVRTVLAPFADLLELDDEGLCCGAGGAWSADHPEMAALVRDRKMGSIARSGALTVASANPGCALHLAAAGCQVRHPLEIIDEVLGLGDGGRSGGR